ncbi:hypothetical protein DMB95_00710 [Campylobacter sp. MIT 12-8780]|nr:hypothetical protein DMB95_00710 [Campylobacter sp. MIT 12-8780]
MYQWDYIEESLKKLKKPCSIYEFLELCFLPCKISKAEIKKICDHLSEYKNIKNALNLCCNHII